MLTVQEQLDLIRKQLLDGDNTSALESVRGVLGESPRLAQAWVFLGEVLERTGNPHAAWLAFRRAWLLDPKADWVGPVEKRLKEVPVSEVMPWLEELLRVDAVTVGAAIIVKDEVGTVGRCIESLRDAVDEIVVVDTGSTDGTLKVLEDLGIRPLKYGWTGSFADARNFALEHVKADWVLWIDADEWLHPDDREALRTAAGIYHGFGSALTLRIVQVNDVGGRLDSNFDMSRIHPNAFGIHWVGRIHEQLVADPEFADPNGLIPRMAVNVRLNHSGYLPTVMQAKEKLQRNIELLRAAVRDDPDDLASWGFLGRELLFAGEIDGAIAALYRAETLGRDATWYARLVEVRTFLVEALLKQERIEEARAVVNRGVKDAPEFPGIWYAKGRVELVLLTKLLGSARQAFEKAQTTATTYRGMVTYDALIPVWRAKAGIADAVRFSGDLVLAKKMYEDILKIDPKLEVMRRQVERIEQQGRLLGAELGVSEDTTTSDGEGSNSRP